MALAPAIAALIGIGAVIFWRQREQLDARLVLAAVVGVTAIWSFSLLSEASDWQPWLRYAVVVVAGVVAMIALATSNRAVRWLVAAGAAVAVVAMVGGSAGYAVQTAATVHSGAIPSAGPASAGGGRFRGAPGGTSNNPPAGSAGQPGAPTLGNGRPGPSLAARVGSVAALAVDGVVSVAAVRVAGCSTLVPRRRPSRRC